MNDDYAQRLWTSGLKYEPIKMVVLKINEFGSEKVANSFIKTISENTDLIQPIIHEILSLIAIRPDTIQPFISVFKLMFQDLEDDSPITTFRKNLFSACFKSAPSYRKKIPHFNFLREMMKADIFSIKDIGNKIAKFPSSQGNTYFSLLLYFAPELSAHRKTTYSNCLEKLSQCSNIESSLQNLGNSYAKLVQDKFLLLTDLINSGSGPSQLSEAIFKDKSIYLEQIIDTTEKGDKPINKLPIEINEFLTKNPYIIEYAAYFGAVECIDYLLSLGVPPNQATKYAVAAGRLDVLEHLIGRSCSADKVVATALATYRFDLLPKLKEILGEEIFHIQLECALYKFTRKGNYIAMMYILSLGVDINVYDVAHCTPVIYAANEGNLTTVKFLQELGANMLLADITDWNPLHFAARGGFIEIFQFLLTLPGFNINMKTGCGDTPLLIAAENEKYDLVYFLLEQEEIDLDSKNIKGQEYIDLIKDPEAKAKIDQIIKKKHEFVLN